MSSTKLKKSSAYHSQSDGQSEVINRYLEQYLGSFVHQWPRKWHSLPLAEFWYNSTFHALTGMTPYQALNLWPTTTIPSKIFWCINISSRCWTKSPDLWWASATTQTPLGNDNQSHETDHWQEATGCVLSRRWYCVSQATALSANLLFQKSTPEISKPVLWSLSNS